MRERDRILYVDDETDIRTITQIELESVGGFTSATCRSGREALETAPGAKPEPILLDVMMPGMDGPATLDALRRKLSTASMPVVFMTAKARPREVVRFKELGALDVIAKPFDLMTLSDAIRRI